MHCVKYSGITFLASIISAHFWVMPLPHTSADRTFIQQCHLFSLHYVHVCAPHVYHWQLFLGLQYYWPEEESLSAWRPREPCWHKLISADQIVILAKQELLWVHGTMFCWWAPLCLCVCLGKFLIHQSLMEQKWPNLLLQWTDGVLCNLTEL